MIKGEIKGRDAFLQSISDKLGRAKPTQIETPVWEFQPQWEVYKGSTQDDLLDEFLKSCERQGTETTITSSTTLKDQLSEMITAFGGGPIVASSDQRFEANGIHSLLKQQDTFFWNLKLGEFNLEQAKNANIGISFSDQALAESGTTIFYHNKENARSISLLPKVSIVIVAKSQLVPRLSQATKQLEERVKRGEAIESYINMISGPSNSADIEMNMVVGVHGPIKVGYIILEDQ